VPLVAMVSYSLVHHRGPERFVTDAAQAGFSGAIVPDLPVDEAEELAKIAARNDFKLILLVTPTTPRERAKRIAQLSTGFLYCVSVVGITGERTELPPDLLNQLRWLRTQTSLPLCVGFGISKAGTCARFARRGGRRHRRQLARSPPGTGEAATHRRGGARNRRASGVVVRGAA